METQQQQVSTSDEMELEEPTLQLVKRRSSMKELDIEGLIHRMLERIQKLLGSAETTQQIRSETTKLLCHTVVAFSGLIQANEQSWKDIIKLAKEIIVNKAYSNDQKIQELTNLRLLLKIQGEPQPYQLASLKELISDVSTLLQHDYARIIVESVKVLTQAFLSIETQFKATGQFQAGFSEFREFVVQSLQVENLDQEVRMIE